MKTIIIGISLLAQVVFASTNPTSIPSWHARSYQFSFEKGNLLQNWSLENDLEGWYTFENGEPKNPRINQAESGFDHIRAVTGSYVAEVNYTQNNSGLISKTFRLESSKDYSISFWYASPNLSENLNVQITFISKMDSIELIAGIRLPKFDQLVLAKPIVKVNGWTFYSATFVTPSWVTDAKLALGAKTSTSSSMTGSLFIDDVVLEPGTVASTRQKIGESIKLIDTKGKQVQAFSRLSVSGVGSEKAPVNCLDGIPYYASNNLEIRNQIVLPGTAVAGGTLSVQSGSKVLGNVISQGKVFLGDRANITGNVSYGTVLEKQNGIVINGTTTKGTFTACVLNPVTVNASSANSSVLIGNGGSGILAPGSYNEVRVLDRGSLTLLSGEYDLINFYLGTDVKLIIKAESGPVTIRVGQNMNFADRTLMQTAESSTTNLVRFHYAGSNEIRLGASSQIFGQFYAPNAKISVANQGRAMIQAWAKDLSIEASNTVVETEFFGANGEAKWLITHAEYDDLDRPTKQYLPTVAKLDQVGYIDQASQISDSYYNGTSAPDAGGFPFQRTEYLSSGQIKSFPAGLEWKDYVAQSGTQFVKDLSIPDEFQDQASVTNVNNALYTLTWSVGQDNNYILQWKDARGRIVQTEENRSFDPNILPKYWTWNGSSRDYYENDYPRYNYASSGNLHLSHKDSRGLTFGIFDPDRGSRNIWYDEIGRVRVMRNDEQKSDNKAILKDYDFLGRVISECEILTGSETETDLQSLAENAGETGTCSVRNGKVLRGVAYDDATTIPATIGIPSGITTTNTRNKMVCRWRTNSDAQLFTINGLVADYFSYDEKGRMVAQWRYQPGMPGNLKLTKINLNFDSETNRLVSETFGYVLNGVFTQLEKRSFQYDNFGRVERIVDGNGVELTSYKFNELGNTEQVLVGNGNLRIGNEWGLKGLEKTTVMTSVGGSDRVAYGEELIRGEPLSGEDGVLDPLDGRRDGRITREIQTRESGQTLIDYGWSIPGQMTEMHKYDRDNNRSAWVPDGIQQWYYAPDGGIASHTKIGTNGVQDSKVYRYNTGVHQLNSISGAAGVKPDGSPRNWFIPGTFQYDLTGNLIEDKSLGILLKHGADGRVTGWDNTDVSGTSGQISKSVVHDFDGNMVGEIVSNSNGQQEARWMVDLGGRQRAEIRQTTPTTTPLVMTVLQGSGGAIGRRSLETNTREWYVKDRKGSVVRVIPENGTSGNEYAYSPYGQKTDIQVSATSPEPTQTWTGKPYDKRTGWTTVGVRVWDSELGVWLSGDPAGQFRDPYTYGGDPVNYVDKDGRWIHIAIGAVIGAGVGAYQAYKSGHGLTDWETYAYVGGGAAIGAGVAATGGAVGGAAGGGIAGGIAGGFVGGAMGGSLNYTLNSGIQGGFSNFNMNDMLAASFKGGFAGMVGGGVGGGMGGGGSGAFSAGFAGGATGASLNGAEGMDIVYGGLAGGGMALGVYSLGFGVSEARMEMAEDVATECPSCPREATGIDRASVIEEEVREDMNQYHAKNTKGGESWRTYQRRNILDRWWSGRQLKVQYEGYESGSKSHSRHTFDSEIIAHHHTQTNFPSTEDYTASSNFAYNYNPRGSVYMIGADNELYYVPPYQTPGPDAQFIFKY